MIERHRSIVAVRLAPTSLASASPRSSDTSAITTLAPFWASLRTVAEPKPPAPPVTIAEALVRSIRAPNRMSYAAVGGPNQVVSASGSPRWVRSPTQATYPSGRINTAVGAVTPPNTGSSHLPTYSASNHLAVADLVLQPTEGVDAAGVAADAPFRLSDVPEPLESPATPSKRTISSLDSPSRSARCSR